MLNTLAMTGRLTADPELRTTDAQVSVLSFSIANQRDFKPAGADDYPVDFYNLVAWRKTAEFIAKHFSKGSLITVVGRLETRSFTDKSGANRKATEIIVEHAYFGDSAKSSQSAASAPVPSSSGEFVPDFSAVEMTDEELPF